MLKSKLTIPLAALAVVISAGTGFVAVANADTNPSASTQGGTASSHQGMHRPAAAGKVTAISGTTVTITAQKGTTYAVDASGATITKHEAPATQGAKPTSTTISVSGINVGDMITVQGTVSGTNVTATSIDDGMFFGGRPGMGGPGGRGVMGTVSAVNGSSITVTGKDGKTYTVDTNSATATKLETISPSDIQVGDTVGVQGTVSGTSVTAKNVMDGIKMPPQKASS